MNNYTINLTSGVKMPDVDYINELAVEKKFSLGRSFQDCPKILEDLYYLFAKENKDPDIFDVKNYLFSKKKIEEEILGRPLDSNEAAYYKYTLLFLEKIEYDSVIGVTPMDKALNVLMYLVHLSKKTNPEDPYNATCDPAGQNVNVGSPEDLAEAIKDVANGIDTESSSHNDKEELSKEMTRCVRDHLYDLTPSIAHIYGAKRPIDVPINKRIIEDLKVKSYLENSKGLETSLDSKKVKNNDSQERDKFQMDKYDQVTKVKKSQMMLENFDDKFVKKELSVTEKVKPETKKQMLYVLLDDSGSMGNLTKQTYVRATLMNRLEQVVDGKASLKFALYESQRYGFHEVTDKLSAKKLYREISLRRPSGGGTYIGRVLQETIDEIHNVPGHYDPEIMIVCDGDDYVEPEKLDYKGVRINVVLLGTTNKGLEKIAADTDGFFTCEQLYNRH